MNCQLTRTERGLFVQITLSERNIEALQMDPRPISRVTRMADGTRVVMMVAGESDSVHYHSPMRDPEVKGQAGPLERLDEEGEGIEFVVIPE